MGIWILGENLRLPGGLVIFSACSGFFCKIEKAIIIHGGDSLISPFQCLNPA